MLRSDILTLFVIINIVDGFESYANLGQCEKKCGPPCSVGLGNTLGSQPNMPKHLPEHLACALGET